MGVKSFFKFFFLFLCAITFIVAMVYSLAPYPSFLFAIFAIIILATSYFLVRYFLKRNIIKAIEGIDEETSESIKKESMRLAEKETTYWDSQEPKLKEVKVETPKKPVKKKAVKKKVAAKKKTPRRKTTRRTIGGKK